MRVLLCIHLACSLVLIPAVSFSMDMDDRLDALGDQLSVASDNGQVRARVSGLLEMDAYVFNGEPPSLIRTHNEYLIQPRAVFFLDVQAGPTGYGFAQARVDRGFDPSEEKTEFRLDEYAVRYTPWNDGRLSLQAGQFATVVGRWVTRHLSWQTPFVSAPLIY